MNNEIIMLGTGNGGTFDLYNTCFVIRNDKGDFLVDTGGSIDIIKRLKFIVIRTKDLKNILGEKYCTRWFGTNWNKLRWHLWKK